MKKKIICSAQETIFSKLNSKDDKYYLGTHDVANYLQIKQPFELNAAIKEKFGDESIVTGTEAEDLVTIKNKKDTTFIAADALLKYLENCNGYTRCQKMSAENKEKLIKRLKTLSKKAGQKVEMGTVSHKVTLAKNPSDNEFYIRIHDLADYLEISQPFQLTANIKEALGDTAVISGDFAKNIRLPKENARTVFVSIKAIEVFFFQENKKRLGIKYNKKRLETLINKEKEYIKRWDR